METAICHNCPDCRQPIGNPICETCYTKQLALLLHDYTRSPKTVQYIIRALRKCFEFNGGTNVFCIICGNETVSLCTYCYFYKVERILRELNLPSEVVDHFLQLFNYQLYNSRNLP